MDEEAAAVIPNPAEVDDDFSPQDAFNLFTPSIYRPGVKDRTDVDPFDVLAPPGSLGGEPGDGFTFDSPLSAVTLSAIGGGSKSVAGSGINGPLLRTFNSTLTQLVPPDVGAPENDGWIFGELEDTILLPVVLATIGLFAVLGNSLLLLTLAGLRRMRSGPNLMLANVALADLVFVAVTVPTAVVNHVTRAYYFISTGDDVIGPRVCRFVYYVIFVTVYVSVYTLVVSSVFRFFGELIRGNSAPPNASGKRTDEDLAIAGIQARSLNPPVVVCATGKTVNDGGLQIEGGGNVESSHQSVPLSACSAVVSCAVVWVAFAASHLTFVIQSDVSGLAAFEKPIVCVYSVPDIPGGGGPSGNVGNDATVADPSRVRTLWITFLACAFLLPLAIVCCSSAAVLKIQRRSRRRRYNQRVGARDESVGSRLYSSAACSSLAPAAGDDTNEQNADNDGRAKREMTTVIMASTVARAVCWLPLQIFILLDIFGPEPEPDATGDLYQKLEMIGICMALVGACVGPPICRIVSSEFRDAFRLVARRVFCCCRRRRREPPYVSSRLIVREPPPLHTVSASTAVSAATPAPYLHRQLSRQATPMLPCCEHDQRQPLQQHTQQHHMTAIKSHLMYRPDLGQLVPGSTSVSCSGRQSASDMNETILSIISDSSNHINYA